MNEESCGIALWIVVAWPLLLAIPALHSRLPWPRHLAVVPAAVLMVLPGHASLDLPWLLFGTGLAVDGEIRWILAMSVAIWLMAATVGKTSERDPAYDRTTLFFLLTLTGNLGAVLAADLVGFFSFSTLMGYSFYGLLVQGGNDEGRRAGRLYVIFLIVADLALFEALLIAASTTENLRFEAVRLAMAGAPSLQFYLYVALAGFALKAGIWPVHLWLSAAFKSARRSTTLLLGGVPVAMALLGAVRWLPLGELTLYVPGTVIQVVGAMAIPYAALGLFTQAPVKMLPTRVTVATTGLFIAALGTGLAHPAIWRQHAYLVYPFIASSGVFLAVLTFTIGRLQDARQPPDSVLQQVKKPGLAAGRWFGRLQRWTMDGLLRLQSLRRVSSLKVLQQTRRIFAWGKPEDIVAGWSAAITLFVLMGLVLAWLAG